MTRSKLLRSLTKTYRSSFSTVLIYPVFETVDDDNPEYVRNVIIVATDAAAPSTAFLRKRWQEIRKDAPCARTSTARSRTGGRARFASTTSPC